MMIDRVNKKRSSLEINQVKKFNFFDFIFWVVKEDVFVDILWWCFDLKLK